MRGAVALDLRCPACRSAVEVDRCARCGRSFPEVAGIADLRLGSDRYLPIDAERAKAERLATIAEGTDLAGVARAYYAMTHDVDPARCRKFLAHILSAESRGEALADALEASGPILEVGCGTGGLLVAAARRGMDITGVDLAARWLVVARRRLDDRGCHVPLIAASAEALPWDDASFGAVVADSVIEHLDDPLATLREWRRVLRPGGQLLLWSPNRWSLLGDPHVRLWGIGFLPRSWANRYARLRRGGAWVPRTLTARAAESLAQQAGFRAISTSVPKACAGAATGLLQAYEFARRIAPGRSLLKTLGPLWTLEARA